MGLCPDNLKYGNGAHALSIVLFSLHGRILRSHSKLFLGGVYVILIVYVIDSCTVMLLAS